MRTFSKWTSRLALAAVMIAALASAGSAQIKINEIRIDHTGTDTDEYFELKGPAGTPLANLTYIVVGDTGTVVTCGFIEAVIPLGAYSIQADGFLSVGDAYPGPTLAGVYDVLIPRPPVDPFGAGGLNFENTDNVTHLLVSGFTGSVNQDLDTNDDGVFDVTPWAAIVDAVGIDKGTTPNCNGEEYLYSATRVGPDGAFVPGHVYRCSDTDVWKVGVFALGSTDTPGRANLSCRGALPQIIDESRAPCVPLVGQAVSATAILRHVTGANLLYTVNGGAETVLGMAFTGLSGTDSVYQVSIPGRPTNADRIEYRVKAYNGNPDTVSGHAQGYFVGTTNIATLRVNDAFGQTKYPFFGARVRGTVTVADGVFSSIDTDYYIQDATSGINVFKFGRHQVQPGSGDDATITGVLDQFRGKLELTEGGPCDTMLVVVNDVGAPPDPVVVNTCNLGESHEGMLVRLNWARIVTTDTQFPAGANADYPLINCEGDTAALRIDRDTDIDGAAIENTVLHLVGIVAQFDTLPPYDGSYQVTPRSLDDITFIGPTAVGARPGADVALLPPSPNPFTRSAVVRYRIAAAPGRPAVHVKLTLHDIQGREIVALVDGLEEPGEHSVVVNAAALARTGSGIHFYRLDVAGRIYTVKAVLLR